MRLSALIAFAVLILPSFSWAFEIKEETTSSLNYITASAEVSQFSLPDGTIQGDGVRVGYSHYFNDSIDFDISLGTAINGSAAGSSSFTGLSGYFYYTLFGSCCSVKKTISSLGVPMMVEKDKKKNSFEIGAGLDQYFLNGSAAVYSISGLGVGAKYEFSLFNLNFEAAARYSVMSANGLDIKGAFADLGIVFDL